MHLLTHFIKYALSVAYATTQASAIDFTGLYLSLPEP